MKLSIALAPALALSFACGVAPRDSDAREDADAEQGQAPVVLNIGNEDLRVARFDLDLDIHIARFLEPAAELPLDRVSIFGAGPDQQPEDLSIALARCNALWGYEVTGGAAFVVGQGESLSGTSGGGSACAPCGFTLVCPSTCPDLGPGEIPRADPSTYDTDPAEGDTGVDNGGGGSGGGSGGGDSSGTSSGSGGNKSGGSTSGGSTGGSGGSSGGVGQPGGD